MVILKGLNSASLPMGLHLALMMVFPPMEKQKAFLLREKLTATWTGK